MPPFSSRLFEDEFQECYQNSGLIEFGRFAKSDQETAEGLPHIAYDVYNIKTLLKKTRIGKSPPAFINILVMAFEKLNSLSKIKRKESQKWP